MTEARISVNLTISQELFDRLEIARKARDESRAEFTRKAIDLRCDE